ncbi:hypothetical protein DL237_15435 [Pseudooceanicola sediminis]|mgnify:CR=1 FL=1|uniref:PRC-barrel domain-containing protein n=1 Tax=Pseudooceanicola sediminis TaxID=2211117 RepID=A0A399IX63_9RHOB|nr:PRC-barrel domain-containing protein [Pseudooceanicola sediminis]KAA2313141.1 hypothetical protein E0K93_15065 [Puniceibacterium sp. HSS470]RII37788.1 hypothetical protein DL237_15435 [Pseudooceanicola sediminis]|tara:strand:- start:87816 stop:88454 length:639 start_codon:yes stop_codon:yes gene_type:complete
MTTMKTLLSGAAAIALLTTPVMAETTSTKVDAEASTSVQADPQVDGVGEELGDVADATGNAIADGADATAEAFDDATDEVAEESTEMANDTEATVDEATDEVAENVGEDVAPMTMTAEDLEGYSVKTTNGDDIGEIDSVVLINGNAMAVVGIGGFLGLGEHDVALPLSDLTFDGTDVWAEGYTKSELEAMAEFDDDNATEVNDDEPVMLGKS